jgi:hypothetical protein
LILRGREGRNFAVALPKLDVVTVNELPGVLLRQVVIRTGKLDGTKEPTVYSDNERAIFSHLPALASARGVHFCSLFHGKSALENTPIQQNNNKSNGLITKKAYFQIRLPSASKHISVFNE